MARLILATAEGQQAIELRPINSLGRHPNNSIQLLDKIVSKEHCILEQRDGQFILRELGSLNGTYITGERVRGEQVLRHGDEITLGSTRARYDDGVQPLPPAAQLPLNVIQGLPPPAIVQPGGPNMAPQPMQPMQPVPAWPQQPGAPASAMMQQPMQPMQRPMGMPQQGMPPQQPRPMGPGGPVSGPAPMTPQMGGPGYQRPARPPSFSGTRVDVLDSARAIGTQIAAQTKGFLPFDQIAQDPQQLRLDYERLRITWELTRDIGLERDFDKLIDKILQALFRFV